jgi:hypothetical protein
VKPLARVPLSLLGLVTTTATAPPTCDGVVATIDVLLAMTTVVAAGTRQHFSHIHAATVARRRLSWEDVVEDCWTVARYQKEWEARRR